ncbi:hypothetical protein [Alkalicoccus luteus]|uniref:hypothetical protein n=1 Tax=Alkalicoccus luteus TaxID=1237094 RepID=UPI00143A3E2B|nr:hypothetical protein [Alkalicoccus luteus]
MPFADLNGTGSSDCADPTGVPAGHIGETALIHGEQRHDRQVRPLFLPFILNCRKNWHPYSTSKRRIGKVQSVWKPIVQA